MDIIKCLIVLISVNLVYTIYDYKNKPRIQIEDGNMVFIAPKYKNISFQTYSKAGVYINHVDVLSTLNRADNATKLTEDYRHTLSAYSKRLVLLEERLKDSSAIIGNASVTTSDPATRLALTRLGRRLTALNRRLINLQNRIYEKACDKNPCQNGGECLDLFNNYKCLCKGGWEGPDCSDDVNECGRFQGTDLGCQNGARCNNLPGTYECVCSPGFVGLHCTSRKADCLTSGAELCGHGTCIPQNTPVGYKCICDQGWKVDSSNGACSVDVDECDQNHPACSKNPPVSCVNVPGSFYCAPCPQGFTGNGYHCSDIDECLTNNGGCSQNPMVTCINTHGSRICGLCPPGYSGDGISCTYVGVCNVNNGGCHQLAKCKENSGIGTTYVECICPHGYVGSGKGPNGCVYSSNVANPCLSNPCKNGGVCSTSGTSDDYSCSCVGLYAGRNCDVIASDPCTSDPCLNGGQCVRSTREPHSFTCKCAQGFYGLRCDSELPACGQTLRKSNGTLKYPSGEFQSFGGVTSCEWVIMSPSTEKILNITFTNINIQNSIGCRNDFIEIYEGINGDLLGRFCGRNLPLGGHFTTSQNSVLLKMVSNTASSQNSFQLSWNSVQSSCGRTVLSATQGVIRYSAASKNRKENCHWVLYSNLNRRIRFHVTSLQIGNNKDCSGNYIKFTSREETFREICNNSIPEAFLSPGSHAKINFRIVDSDIQPGFEITYTSVEATPGCGGTFTANTGVIQPPVATENMLCEYKIDLPPNSTIELTFDEPIPNTFCETDNIEIREGPNADSPLVGRFCGTNTPTNYVSYGNQIYVASTLYSDSNRWKMSYKRVCLRTYTAPSDTIVLGTADHYMDSCVYQIQQPAGYVIQANLKTSFKYGGLLPTDCSLYSVTIRDGDNKDSPILGNYCRSIITNVTSTHNHLWINVMFPKTFGGDQQLILEYVAIEIGCGGILRNTFGTIASPTHTDGSYRSSLKCTWLLLAPKDHVIQLSWNTFSLEHSYECTYDNVQVFDNSTGLGSGELLGQFCGFTLPPILLSSSNVMTVVFNSDVTVSMDGFLASYIFIHESKVCGGNYFTSAGVLKSPNYPKPYPTSRECTWTITVPHGQQIMLNVTDFDVEYFAECRYDWLEIRNGGSSSSPLVGRYCGTTIPKLIPSHTNKFYVSFTSDLNRNGRGFNILWSSAATGCGGTLTSPTGSITSPQYPESYSRNTECLWRIVTSAGSVIQVIFSDIQLERQMSCIADYVELFDGTTTNSKSLGKYCNEGAGPIRSTGNKMLVKFRSDVGFQGRGFQLHYSTGCNNTITGYRGIIESPNFPNEYQRAEKCQWDVIVPTGNKINITFSHFDMERSVEYVNKSCISDYLEIKYQDNSNNFVENSPFNTFGKYCGTDDPGHHSIDSNHIRLNFVTDYFIEGNGFRLEWELFGCGGHLKQTSGTITTPNYPNSYPPLITCEWIIEVDYGLSIEIEFHEIDVEHDNACQFDKVAVYNGIDDTYNLLAQMCHQKKTSVISSSGNFMFVKFESDYSYQGKGFTANFSTIPTKCGGRFTTHVGSIFSPNYPKNFNFNDTCFWLIDVDENHSIDLVFEDFDLLNSPNCTENYVKIYNGPNEAYPLLQTLCGNEKPNNTIHSTFNNMFIEFRSTLPHLSAKGFSAKYYKACGSRLTDSSGFIEIHPNEFMDYVNNCTWIIQSTDLSQHVSLTITHIEADFYCDEYKPIQIFNGDSVGAPLLEGLCGTKVPPTIVSTGSALTLLISSPMTFFATYATYDNHCGGSLSSSEGLFASPGYPKTYPSNAQCEWTLKVSPGNTVSLNFIEFDLLESENCNTDYLEIRKENASGKMLGVFCGRNSPINITNVGTLWLIFKSSKLQKGESAAPAKGFKAEYKLNYDNELNGPKGEIFSPLYPNIYSRYSVFTWRITVKTGMKILLTFKEFYIEASEVADVECYYSKFEIYDGVDDTTRKLGQYCGNISPAPIKSTTNVLFIRMEYTSSRIGSKFRVEWLEIPTSFPIVGPTPPSNTSLGCDRVIDIETKPYRLTSPGYPGGYEHNMKCQWIFNSKPGTHISISFTDINFAHTFPGYFSNQCRYTDVVNLYQRHLEENNWELFQAVCEKNSSNRYYSSENMLKVEFLTTRFLNGTGFAANITSVCGGTLFGPTSYIVFDNRTVRGEDCQWNISVRSTRMVEVTIEEMNIDYDSNRGCNNYLLIRNGKFADSPLLGDGKFCGNDLPAPLKSTSNNVYVKYHGPSTSTFRIKFQETKSSYGGTMQLTQFDPHTEISSPNYPNIPNAHIEVDWVIIAPPGESLRIDFEERFDLTKSNKCDVEYVEVRDGGTEKSRLMGRYCSSTPSSQITSDNMMFVRFFTDTDDPKNGFKAKISINKCGGTYRGSEGYFRQADDSQRNANCTWHLIGPRDHYLMITFIEFNINHFGSCDNYVEILEPPSPFNLTDYGTPKKFCSVPGTVTTQTNEAIVKYTAISNGTFAIRFMANQTSCGEDINQESGIIQSPGYPLMNHLNRACLWKITVPEGRRISLRFLDIDLHKEKVSQNSLVVSEPRFRILLFNFRRGDTDKLIESSSNKMWIYFRSNNVSNRRGFKAIFSSNEPTICQGKFSGESGVISNPHERNHTYYCDWTYDQSVLGASQTLAMTINVVLNTNRNSTPCHMAFQRLTIYKGESDILTRMCETTKEPIISVSPFPETKILAEVNAGNEMNFTVSYKRYPCGGMVVGEKGEIKSPNYPNNTTTAVYCAWSLRVPSDQTINLTSTDVNLGDDCDKSYLVVYNGELPTSPRIDKFCRNMLVSFLSQNNYLYIEYKWEPGSTGKGMHLNYEAMSTGCGGIFHDSSRIIHSPNYGSHDYPNNAECLWEIITPPGYYIKLDFLDRFHIEESNSCENDFIEVWDWKDDKWVSLGKKCGRTAPTDLHSSGTRLKFLFRSNEKIVGTGFKVQWKWYCGGTFHADKEQRYIISPGYPLRYSNDLTCSYQIVSNDNINIVFEDFELEVGTPECKYDNLTISSNFRILRPITTACGTNKPSPLTIYKNVLIVFKTDHLFTSKGYKFSYYDQSCGGNVTQETEIEYHLNDNNPMTFGRFGTYGTRVCEWKITAPTNKIVLLSIINLNAMATISCFGQYLDVYDNPTKRLARLCGFIERIQPISSTNNSMIVRLNSGWRGFKSFKAAISFIHGPAEGCGGTIQLSSTQYIQSPNLDHAICFWKIMAPTDYQIVIEFPELNLPSECNFGNKTLSTCDCASIKVHDGGGPFSDLIERVCSNQTGGQVRTVGNTAFVSYHFLQGKENAFKMTLKPELSICGQTVLNATNSNQILTSPEYPSTYPSVRCFYTFVAPSFMDKVSLHFVDFDLTPETKPYQHDQLTRCVGDSVEILEDVNAKMVSEGLGPSSTYRGSSAFTYLSFNDEKGRHIFCGKNEKPFDYYSTGKSVTLLLNSKKNVSNRGRGFKLEYAIAGCNRNYTESIGRISNGNNKSDCTISISVPENRTISLYFNLFYMFRSINCTEAFFVVRDGSPNGPILLTGCGYRVPDPVFSFTNKLYIRAKNRANSFMKYDFDYVSTEAGRGCGGEIYNYKGKIYSPMYPREFRNDTKCTWTVKVPVGLHATLKFMKFEIQGNCEQNYIQILTYTLDSDGRTIERATKYCSGDKTPAISRSESLIKIIYKSSSANGGSGWYALYQSVTADAKNLL